MNEKVTAIYRRSIAYHLIMWRKHPSIAETMLCCAAISATFRGEFEFFTWAVKWLTKQEPETCEE